MTRDSSAILVVDDDLALREVLVELLADAGFAVRAAASGAEALALLAARRFAAVLVDWYLPDVEGPALARRVREDEGEGRRTPLIAVTGATALDARARCLAAGMDDHVGKPFQPADLLACVRRWTAPAGRGAALDEDRVAMLGRLGLVERLYPAFLAALPEQVAGLRASLRCGDRGALSRQVHRLRGSAAQLGATALARTLGVLEDAVDAGDLRVAPDAEFDEAVRTTAAALQEAVEAARAARGGGSGGS